MNGYLEKRSGNLYVYQTRYFIRENNLLNYYAKQGDKKPRGSINLYNLSALTLVENSTFDANAAANGMMLSNIGLASLSNLLIDSALPNSNFSSPRRSMKERVAAKFNAASPPSLTSGSSPSSPKMKAEDEIVSRVHSASVSAPGSSSPRAGNKSVDPKEVNKKEFMLQVGDRNFILRASDHITRQAWVEELTVWVNITHKDEHIQIPKPTVKGLLKAIEYCMENGATTEGLFRVPGFKPNIDAICLGVYMCGDAFFDPATFPQEYTVLDVGSAIKKLLRELPENIFSSKLLPAFRIATIPSTVKDMIPLLPVENINILSKLMELCDLLCKNTEYTKMTPKNLSISFGPSLSNDNTLNSTGLGALLEILITERENIFAVVPDIDLNEQTKFAYVQSTRPKGSGIERTRQSIWKARRPQNNSGLIVTSDDKEDISDEDDPEIYDALNGVKPKGIRAPLEKLHNDLESKDKGFLSSVDNLLQIADLIVGDAEHKKLMEENAESEHVENRNAELESEKKKSRLLAARIIELENMVTILNNAAVAAAAAVAASQKKK